MGIVVDADKEGIATIAIGEPGALAKGQIGIAPTGQDGAVAAASQRALHPQCGIEGVVLLVVTSVMPSGVSATMARIDDDEGLGMHETTRKEEAHE